MACTFTELIVDAIDAQKISEFWCAALGWQPTGRYSEAIEIGGPDSHMATLVFVPNTEPKHGKNRLHIDVNPRDYDQAEEVERLISLGARRADIGQGQQSWVVLADPEGNEFCVLQKRIDAK
jgi:hypothetical protein